MRTSIITCRQSSKPLLPSGIPNLELNALPIHLNCFNFEINTNGIEEVLIERIFLEKVK
jgi:hypothetical protein